MFKEALQLRQQEVVPQLSQLLMHLLAYLRILQRDQPQHLVLPGMKVALTVVQLFLIIELIMQSKVVASQYLHPHQARATKLPV